MISSLVDFSHTHTQNSSLAQELVFHDRDFKMTRSLKNETDRELGDPVGSQGNFPNRWSSRCLTSPSEVYTMISTQVLAIIQFNAQG